MTTTTLAAHHGYVSKTKHCEYKQMQRLGFPSVTLISTLPGTSIRDKVLKWCGANWYLSQPIIQYFSDFVQYTAKEGKVYHATESVYAREAIEAVFEFIQLNVSTLEHLKTALTFQEGQTPFEPKISKELVEMSFMERQALLKANRESRLEEVKGE